MTLVSPGAEWLSWAKVFLIGMLSFLPSSSAFTGCPAACFCNTISQIVYCSRRGLPYIPNGIPKDSLQINLSGNVFKTSSITRANFSDYPQLEHLYLSECGIETIEVETFVDLGNLKWLDLSNNRIRVLQDYTFRGLQLQHLFLNGNRNMQLRTRSFAGLETTGLYLHECSLKRLHPDVLFQLNLTLKYLWLDGNELERLDKKLLPLFQSLSHLRLGSNPFHCNCEVIWLKEFYDKNGEIFKGSPPPSCLTPMKLKGKFFNTLSLFDFRCSPPVFNNIDAVFDSSQGRLRCTASGDPAPTLFWIQPSGESSRYSPPQDDEARSNEGVLAISPSPAAGPNSPAGDQKDDLSGMYICLAFNDAGNVTLTLNVSWPHLKNGLRTDLPPTLGHRGHHHHGRHPHHIETPGSSLPPSTLPPTKSTKTSRSHDDVSDVSNQNNVNNNKNSPAANGKDRSFNNFTALHTFDNVYDFNSRRSGGRLFNLTELVGAIIGTHVCTLLLCLILMPIYLKRQWKKRHSHHALEKPPNDSLYLNGLGHTLDYMDTPSPKR